jgi:hypothetical protein
MPPACRPLYSSKIIKAGALLADTKVLLAEWDLMRPVRENLERFRRENLFGKASRKRVEDVLAIFRQRYLADPAVARALVVLVKGQLPDDALDRILYFQAAQADPLLRDVVVQVLGPARREGQTGVTVEGLQGVLASWVKEGRTSGPWSAPTCCRIAQGLAATLRDFGVLQGAVRKRLAPFFLPVEAFTYVALYLRQRQPSGDRLVSDPEWRLFFLDRAQVEGLFAEAHQRRLLEYHAAGSVVRISFPTNTLEEYAHVITRRSA